MNKQKKLMKQLSILVAVVVGVLCLFGGLYYFTDSMIASEADEKTQADTELATLQTDITNLQTQLDKSGEAEQGYTKIKLERTSLDFTPNADALKEMLRAAKGQYRFSNSFKLSITPEAPTDKAELKGLNYNVMVRPAMKMELDAISDMHVFSFLKALEQEAPGFVKLNAITIKRKSDMDATSINEMQHGGAPFLVEATIDFDWIGINEKAAAAPAAAPAATGQGK